MRIMGVVFLACATAAVAGETADLKEQVRGTEAAFAKTMADRDAVAFASFLSDEAVFVGGKGVARGKAAVADQWKRFFAGAAEALICQDRCRLPDQQVHPRHLHRRQAGRH